MPVKKTQSTVTEARRAAFAAARQFESDVTALVTSFTNATSFPDAHTVTQASADEKPTQFRVRLKGALAKRLPESMMQRIKLYPGTAKTETDVYLFSVDDELLGGQSSDGEEAEK